MTECKHFRRKGVTTEVGQPVLVCAHCGNVKGRYTKDEIIKLLDSAPLEQWPHDYAGFVRWIEENL